MISLIGQACAVVFSPVTFLYIFVGTVVGVIFGAMPGVSASMAVVLAMTFSYSMDALPAIAFLVAVYCAAITGGGITAILFSIPGTPSSATTTFDGYPMAQRGEAGRALGISLVTSAIGGMFSAFCMALLTQPLASAALAFGPAELFGVSFLGLSILTCLDNKNVLRTISSGLIGLLIACVGTDPVAGVRRFTWDIPVLVKGVALIPVMVGLFAIVEVFKKLASAGKKEEGMDVSKTGKVRTKLCSPKELWEMKATILRSAVLGTLVGILPGAGATIASFLSYAVDVRCSSHPETYGKGEPCGIAASETANNAATGGAMVPMLALGIPGGNAAAVMVTALAIKGVNMGPLLMTTQPVYLYTVFVAQIVVNIIMVIVAVYIARVFAKILSVPYSMLGTIIVMLSVIGAYSYSKATSDVMIMAIAAIIGYLFIKCHFNSAALILGLVLGAMVEKNLRNAFVVGHGSFVEAFLTKPIAVVLLIACAILLFWPLISKFLPKKEAKQA